MTPIDPPALQFSVTHIAQSMLHLLAAAELSLPELSRMEINFPAPSFAEFWASRSRSDLMEQKRTFIEWDSVFLPTTLFSDPHPFLSDPQPFFSDPQPFLSDPQPFFSDPQPFFSDPQPFFSDPQPFFSDPQPFFSDPQPFFTDPQPFFSDPSFL